MEHENVEASLNKKYEEAVHEIIKKHLKRPIEDFDITCLAGSSKGDNYIGQIFRLEVIAKDTKVNKLNLIAKVPYDDQVRRELGTPKFFIREALFYDKVYPMYKNFQALYRIDIEKDGFYQVPFCYKTMTEAPHEALFFDDLKVEGFLMYDRFKELTREHVMLVMKTLAKLHAVFFALKDQLPNLIQEFVEMKELFIIIAEMNELMNPWFESLKKQALEIVNKSENLDMVEKINKLLQTGSMSEMLKNTFDREKTEPYAVLCHGDCWNNNMMFQNDKNGAPKDVRFLDFQVIRYASPVCDVLFYIFGCTTKPLRDKYYQEFLNVYYDELSNHIKRLGSDPEKVFPRTVFEKHLKIFGHFGLLMAMMVLPNMTTLPSDVPDPEKIVEQVAKLVETGDIQQKSIGLATDGNRNEFEERMMGVCNDMYSLGYI